jgi:subtilisin family serine protease
VARYIVVLLALATSLFAQPALPGRYIVELAGEPAIRARDIRGRQAEIRSQQREVERLLVQRRWRVEAKVQTVANALIVEGDPVELAAIARMRGVRRIVPDRELRLMLERARIVHRVEEAWSKLTEEQGGFKNAGRGVKIAILDTGIEPEHPGFNPEGMEMPEGYPQVSGGSDSAAELNRRLTNAKVIVARSYDAFSARDVYGHGTAVAMAAAGVMHTGPTGPISGMAPRAWIGVYRVNRGETASIPTSYVLRALDDAANDGMNVVNASFGFVGLSGPADDPVANAMRALADGGVIVVCAAGNDGPGPMTVDDSASDGKVIAVGANTSDRIPTTPALILETGPPIAAQPASNSNYSAPIGGELVDVEPFDGDSSSPGLACRPLRPESLTNRIALIRRGECNFTVKIENAKNAGAIAAVVYNRPDDTNPDSLLIMNVDENPTLMALFVGYSDGRRLKAMTPTNVFLRFYVAPGNINRVASFSSQGPSVELAIKPDLVATGAPVLTAARRGESGSCAICDPSGYLYLQGTSFAAPIVAGAAAVLRQARPGLEPGDYKSLLVNGTAAIVNTDGAAQPVMSTGAGRLDLFNSLSLTVTASPVSLSFGSGQGTVDSSRSLLLKNIGGADATYTFSLEPGGPLSLQLSSEILALAPGEAASITATLASGGLEPGAYQGFIVIRQEGSEAVSRIPYWYSVRYEKPSTISVVGAPSCVTAGSAVTLYARLFDPSGVNYEAPGAFGVEAVTPGAFVVRSGQSSLPLVYEARLQLSSTPGINSFIFKAEGLSTTVNVRGSASCN